MELNPVIPRKPYRDPTKMFVFSFLGSMLICGLLFGCLGISAAHATGLTIARIGVWVFLARVGLVCLIISTAFACLMLNTVPSVSQAELEYRRRLERAAHYFINQPTVDHDVEILKATVKEMYLERDSMDNITNAMVIDRVIENAREK